MRSRRIIITSLYAVVNAAVIFCLLGCSDGGTSGTGIRTVQGAVYTTDNSPVENAGVVIVETGDGAVTDSAGKFSITTDLIMIQNFSLRVTHPLIDTTVAVSDVPIDQAEVTVDVTIDPTSNSGEARLIDLSNIQQFELRAGIIGACDRYFENRGDIIRQANEIPNGTECLLRATVYGDGELIGGVLVGIERQACDRTSAWRSVTNGLTSTRVHRGVALIPFRYSDTERSCRFRISAPFLDPQGRDDSVKITTLTEQRLEK